MDNSGCRQLTQIFFSPTGTTRQVLGAIAKGLSPAEIRGYDLTPPEKREHPDIKLTDEDDLVLLGVPVYEEHVPHFLWDNLNAIEGKGKAIVLIAVYGNIGYGMCLKELETWAVKAGFKVLAAAAFIGEHSFSQKTLPLAAGRPDTDDLKTAMAFGKAILDKINAGDQSTPDIPGHLPLMARILPQDSAKFFSHYPKVDMNVCTRCMRCVTVCPSGAIDPGNLQIAASRCLHCFACVRVCAPKARKIRYKMAPLVTNVLTLQTRKRKEPKIII
jgi:ferredoxin